MLLFARLLKSLSHIRITNWLWNPILSLM